MIGRLAIYNEECEARVEIGLTDKGSLAIFIDQVAPGGEYCSIDIPPEAIPEIIGYLQRAWDELNKGDGNEPG